MENDGNFNASETSGQNTSYWLSGSENIKFTKLQENLTTEVLVIGGGIAGLTAAYLLLKSGKKVALIEDGFIGSGESGRTTAHLTCALDDRYYFLEDTFGDEGAKLAAESHVGAIGKIEEIIKEENIECNFKRVDGYLFLDPTDKNDNLLREFEATRKAGINTQLIFDTPFRGQKSLKFPHQAQFHILKYLKGLCEAIIRLGGQIFTETRGANITKIGATANGFQINAQQIVVATNTPFNDIVTMHTKQAAYRTYVIAAKIPKGALPYSLWWDTGNADSQWVAKPYHYVRLEEFNEEFDLLICGGEDHKTGQEDSEGISQQQRYDNLEQWARLYFPAMEEVIYSWSGQVMEPVDSLGFLGRNPGDDNIYIITGDSGNGMTHATIGAMIINDLINGGQNPWESLYSPSRVTLNTAGDYIKEAANMASQYFDWFTPGDLKDVEDLPIGEGGILTSGISKVAAYRDLQNDVHFFNAACPHLGCIVQWNTDEKTFDCPCHGSRFSNDGTLINGPSQKDLEKITLSPRKEQ